MENSIVINNLKKKYPQFQLDIDHLEIPTGSIVGLIGENGAGKSTTIRLLLNLIHADEGSILLFGEDHCNVELKKEIGVVMDDSFFSDYLVINDIPKIMKNFYELWSDELFYRYVKQFQLPVNKMMKEFSSGMKMKLKIITAISHQPKLLILDEPTSGLDPVVRNEILDIFREYVEDGNHTILFSSHITTDLEHIADYIAFLHQGHIVLNEETCVLLEEYGIVKCSKEEFLTLSSKDYISYLPGKYQYDVLIASKDIFKKKHPTLTIDKASLEEIMVLEIKGVRNDEAN